MRRKIVALGLCMSMLLTGCGAGGELATLNSMQSLNSESSNNSVNLSLSERQSLVYAQVSERSLLDLSLLEPCSESDVQQVRTYMDNVDKQLTGEASADNGVISEDFTNYLLFEFEKTPYYWQRTRTSIRGMDAKSRSIIVDVDYSTIGYSKEVKEDSFLIYGEPNYDIKARNRYDRWITILKAKYAGVTDWQDNYKTFVKVYGDPKKIVESQRNETLTQAIFETGNQRTYNGMIDTEAGKKGARMTIRYVLVPKYVLGINLGIECKHLYVTDYEISEDPTEGLELFKEDGYATISENVNRLMDSYFKCIDEVDMSGLYKLTDDFKTMDKYYTDMGETCYSKHSSFIVSLFDINGTSISCGVQVASKIRGKGTEITMPSYTDRYFVNMKLVDEQLKITDMTLLSRKLEGEPTIVTNDADYDGFEASINISADSRVAIEKLICDLSALQLAGDTESDKFGELVDFSMSEDKLVRMKESLATMVGGKKVVFLENYQQGTSNYASVKCRELFQDDKGKITEAEVIYEFILKGDKWYVYGYEIPSSAILDSSSLPVNGALCLVFPNEVESYTSQVGSGDTVAADAGEAGEAPASDNVVFEHEQKTPAFKKGNANTAIVLTIDTLSDAQFEALWGNLSNTLTVDKIQAFDSALGLEKRSEGSMEKEARRLTCLYYNKKNKRVSSKQYATDYSNFKKRYDGYKTSWSAAGDVEVIQAFDTAVNKAK